jgi:hypothetical protein
MGRHSFLSSRSERFAIPFRIVERLVANFVELQLGIGLGKRLPHDQMFVDAAVGQPCFRRSLQWCSCTNKVFMSLRRTKSIAPMQWSGIIRSQKQKLGVISE